MAVSSRKSQNCPQLDPLPPCWHHVGWKKNNLTFFSQFKSLRVCMKKLPLHVRPMLNGIMTLWDRRRFFVTKITQKLSRGLTEFWGWKFCVQGCTAVVWIKKKHADVLIVRKENEKHCQLYGDGLFLELRPFGH